MFINPYDTYKSTYTGWLKLLIKLKEVGGENNFIESSQVKVLLRNMREGEANV